MIHFALLFLVTHNRKKKCCLNALIDKVGNIVHAALTLQLEAHEHNKVGRVTSDLGKWDDQRSM